jgi:type I restriction-modification system DNA methylase subunit
MKTTSKETKTGIRTLQSFKAVFDKAAYGSSYEQVFDDFLTICIACVTRNPETSLSYYEDEYMRVIEPYKALGTLKYFPELFAELILYLEENKDNSQGNDLLGTFFEQELSRGRNGQFFTPFHVCDMMAQITKGEETKPVNVIDPCCGSGRMLLAFAKGSRFMHGYYGIDIDSRCAKMTAINLFLNGLRGEVMCGDTLARDDFRFGYKISIFPLGIFKIETKEASNIWQSKQKEQHTPKEMEVTLPSEERKASPENSSSASQLQLF